MNSQFESFKFKFNPIFNFDPRLKLFSFFILIGLIFFPQESNWPFLYLCFLLFLSWVFWIAEIPKKSLKPVFKAALVMFALIFFFNLLSIGGKTGVADSSFFGLKFIKRIGPLPLYFSSLGLKLAFFYTFRVFLVIFTTLIFAKTTSNYQIVLAFESLLYPLRILRFPVYAFSSILSFSLRLIPTIFKEANQIINAQASRGLDFYNSRLRTKIKILISLIIPLLASIFERAEEMALSLESRGFNPYKKRSRGFSFFILKKDWIIFSSISFMALFFIVVYSSFLSNYNFLTFFCS